MNRSREIVCLAVLALALSGAARAATEKEVIAQVKVSMKLESSKMKASIKNAVDVFSGRLSVLLAGVKDGSVVGSNVLPELEDAINDAVLANYQATVTAWNNVRAAAKTAMLLAALDLPRDLEMGNFTTSDKFQDAIVKAGESARKKMTSLLKKFHAGYHKATSVSNRINAVIVEQPVARRAALNRIHTADATLDFRLTGIVAGRDPESAFNDGLVIMGGCLSEDFNVDCAITNGNTTVTGSTSTPTASRWFRGFSGIEPGNHRIEIRTNVDVTRIFTDGIGVP